MKTIGLDLSINSTGVCVCVDGQPIQYYIIASDANMTKKNMKIASDIDQHIPLKYYIYSKQNHKSSSYITKEVDKTMNINVVAEYIKLIIQAEKPDRVYIEGISYGSIGSAALVDLSGLNFVVRKVLIDLSVSWYIISPTENKKAACGNGAAKKDEMIYAWEACDNRLRSYREQLKFDDLADAYFLAKTPIKNE